DLRAFSPPSRKPRGIREVAEDRLAARADRDRPVERLHEVGSGHDELLSPSATAASPARRGSLLGFGEVLQIGERLIPPRPEPLAEMAELAAAGGVIVETAFGAARDQTGGFEDAEMLLDRAEADVR